MKKRFTVVLFAGAAATFLCGSSVWGMTYAYPDGSSRTYYSENDRAGLKVEYGDYTLTEEEKRDLEAWHKEDMRNELAYVAEYGISYDADSDRIYYQGKTVRWLIDEQIADTYKAFQMSEGEIDVYTVRDKDHKLTGLRVATQEEYDRRTREDEWLEGMEPVLEAEITDVPQASEEGSIIYSFSDGFSIERDLPEAGSGGRGAVSEDSVEFDVQEGSGNAGLAEESVAEPSGYDRESELKAREYEENGISRGNDGSWLWEGKPVFLLLDEDGSLHQNGSEKARENKIYLIVKRKEDGSIKEVKRVTTEEMMEEWIRRES